MSEEIGSWEGIYTVIKKFYKIRLCHCSEFSQEHPTMPDMQWYSNQMQDDFTLLKDAVENYDGRHEWEMYRAGNWSWIIRPFGTRDFLERQYASYKATSQESMASLKRAKTLELLRKLEEVQTGSALSAWKDLESLSSHVYQRFYKQ